MIIDTHCHLASAQFDQSRRETYVQHALREGIDRMITLGARMDDWEANTAWARQFPGAVFCALGIHPDDAHDAPADWADQLFRKAQDVPLAAIGETGLEVVGELAGVEFCNDYAFEAREDLAGVGGEGLDVAELGEGHRCALSVEFFGGGVEVAECASPAYKQGIGFGRVA